jgi:hypothetical protein
VTVGCVQRLVQRAGMRVALVGVRALRVATHGSIRTRKVPVTLCSMKISFQSS